MDEVKDDDDKDSRIKIDELSLKLQGTTFRYIHVYSSLWYDPSTIGSYSITNKHYSIQSNLTDWIDPIEIEL